jgi:hypothetical protein
MACTIIHISAGIKNRHFFTEQTKKKKQRKQQSSRLLILLGYLLHLIHCCFLYKYFFLLFFLLFQIVVTLLLILNIYCILKFVAVCRKKNNKAQPVVDPNKFWDGFQWVVRIPIVPVTNTHTTTPSSSSFFFPGSAGTGTGNGSDNGTTTSINSTNYGTAGLLDYGSAGSLSSDFGTAAISGGGVAVPMSTPVTQKDRRLYIGNLPSAVTATDITAFCKYRRY